MVQASRSPGPRFKDDPLPSGGVVVHGYLKRFVTTSGKDDLGRRLCFLDGGRSCRQVRCCRTAARKDAYSKIRLGKGGSMSRFAPKATEILGRREQTRGARSRHCRPTTSTTKGDHLAGGHPWQGAAN